VTAGVGAVVVGSVAAGAGVGAAEGETESGCCARAQLTNKINANDAK
jgi:hypothetical protein